jgi:hypothetical protein
VSGNLAASLIPVVVPSCTRPLPSFENSNVQTSARLPLSHLLEIKKLPAGLREQVTGTVAEKNLSVRQTKQVVDFYKNVLNEGDETPGEKRIDAEFQRGEENQESGEDEQHKVMDRESL